LNNPTAYCSIFGTTVLMLENDDTAIIESFQSLSVKNNSSVQSP
jgi:hypothetical protein